MSEGSITSQLAVVGMAGRFPGAGDVAAFWRNLTAGTGGIREITQEELTAAKVPPALQADPGYVRRGAPLDGTDLFDAAFFGYSPREAEVADPQHRMFLECAWEALEGAGYRPTAVPGKVGVFGGVAPSAYGMRHVLTRPEVMATITMEQYGMSTTSDALCTMVAYKLGLTGPVVGVQTNCSTSLVAVHLAAQSLLTYDCDMALAGGAAIADPLPVGYRFEDGSIVSPDGAVRSFDADAAGTVVGNGVGVVALKRMADALRDGDHVWAVLLGSAVNNDGAGRAGYGAPGVDGQSTVMSYALAVADVDPGDLDYVECHATGTRLGDSIELAALNRAFPGTAERPRVLSSLKPDIGHLDRASGVAGLIKAVLALHHRVLPATRGYRRPNPALDPGRFTVLTEDRPWPRAARPRRAGVSSFGAGGTNAHVVLQEAAEPPERAAADAGPQLLVLSARTSSALRESVRRLHAWLSEPGGAGADLRDIAHTLQQSRSGFAHRCAVVCAERADAIKALAEPDRLPVAGPVAPSGERVTPRDPHEAAERWLAGADVDFPALHDGPRRRVPLPTYPFERRRYFIERADLPATSVTSAEESGAARAAEATAGRLPDPADWFSHPVWQATPLLGDPDPQTLRRHGPWWVIADGGPGLEAAELLTAAGAEVVCGTGRGPGSGYAGLLAGGPRPRTVLHALLPGRDTDDATAQRLGFHSVRALAGALSEDSRPGPVTLLLCTSGAVEATGGDLRHPGQATLAGLRPVLGQEFGDLTCRLADTDRTTRGADLLREAVLGDSAEPVALRGTDRWVRGFAPVRLGPVPADRPVIRPGSTVLITGGLGTVGTALAERLARRSCSLVLVGRTPLPPEQDWDASGHDARTVDAIAAVRRLRALGAEVLTTAADVADRDAMATALAAARERFGAIDVVIHAAGTQGERYFGFAPTLGAEVCELHFRSKAGGLRVLDTLLAADEAPLRITLSSLAAVLGGVGYGAYAAANAAMDAYARAGGRWLPVNFDTWNLGVDPHGDLGFTMKDFHYDADEGFDVLERCLAVSGRVRQVVVSTGPLRGRLGQWTQPAGGATQETGPGRVRHPRPDLMVGYEPPASPEEAALAEIWGEILGVDGVGVHDSFFDLGGHSLTAVRMMARVRSRFGGFPVAALLENPTVRSFSAVINGRSSR
ncbi:SDR family NAD(P)-dependent oxidoreductase [Streptomyces ardesiacus]